MQIKLQPIVFDDNGEEVKLNDMVMIQTRKMSAPAAAQLNDITMTVITVTFADLSFGIDSQMLRKSDIKSFIKMKA